MKIGKIALSITVVFILIGLCASCTPKTAPPQTTPVTTDKQAVDEGTKIVLLHFNDSHARINDFAKIAWLVEEEKKKNPNVFLLNGGDNFSGNAVVDQYIPKGEPILQILNKLKTDVMVLGNHEFDYGQEILKRAMEKATYPVLCANLKVEGGIIPQPAPYTILKTGNGIKIAVLGLTQIDKDTKLPHAHPGKLKGLVFSEEIETAKKFRHLRKGNQVFIALSHLGYDGDEKLAEEMGELDVIIGAHTHTVIMNPTEVNRVLITQAGSYTRYLGRVEIVVKDGKVTSKKGELIDVRACKNEIPEIKEMIKRFNDNPQLKKVIASIPMELVGKGALGNLITDAVKHIHHLDIALHNEGGIRSFRLGPDVRMGDIFKLLPFGNDIIQFEMTTDEINDLITYSFLKYGRVDLRCSGMEYTVVLTPEKKVKEVILTDESGKLLDESRTYKVGINSYIATAYTFKHKDPGKSLQTIIAQTLIDYLKKGGDIFEDIEKNRVHIKEVNE
jgi:2',3'-cyclic-nucleotide 2'-phosphodiesterase (5'-nucleotidase family)